MAQPILGAPVGKGMGRLPRDWLSSLRGLSPPWHPSFLSEAREVSSCSSSCAGSSCCCHSRTGNSCRNLPGGAGGTAEVSDPKAEGDSQGDVPPLGFSLPHLAQEGGSTRGWLWAGGARVCGVPTGGGGGAPVEFQLHGWVVVMTWLEQKSHKVRQGGDQYWISANE